MYYLDLLVEVDDLSNVRELPPIPETEDDMIQALYRYAGEGWYPAVHSNIISCYGNLTGESVGNTMRHNFRYSPPNTFKTIIVTKSGEVSVSDLITRDNFFSEVVYNARTGKANENSSSGFAQFLLTLIITLVIEGLLLLIFRFKLRDSWKQLLLTNAGTQIFLYLGLNVISSAYGSFFAVLAQPLLEIAIIVIEGVVYVKTLKGQNRGRIKAYAVTANLASWFFGWLLLSALLSLLNRIFV